jgi:hypothetical protein
VVSVAALAVSGDGASGAAAGAVAAAAAAAAAAVVVVVVVVAAAAATAAVVAGAVDTVVTVDTSALTFTPLTRVRMAPGVVVGTAVARGMAEAMEGLASILPANLASRSWSAMCVFPLSASRVTGAYSSARSQLPWSTANEDLIDLFETTGTVEIAEILFSGTRSMGSGVVQFATVEESETAIAKFQGYIYGGRPLGMYYSSIMQVSLFTVTSNIVLATVGIDVRFNDRWHEFTSTAATGTHLQNQTSAAA